VVEGGSEAKLAEHLLKIESEKPKDAGLTFAQAVERYLAAKARKRTIAEDKRVFERLKRDLGAETPLAEITAGRISEYKGKRLGLTSIRTKRELTAASINRPLAALRRLLRTAATEWEVLASVPKIKLEKEPEGRIRWLEPDEECRLLAACAKAKNKSLARIVTVALETGLRRGELLGLTWDRIDLSRGVIRLEVTKSGRRREVPMRQAVYDVLAALPGPREGRVWPSQATSAPRSRTRSRRPGWTTSTSTTFGTTSRRGS
jgi:integrase